LWFDPGLARLFITSTLLHLGEDINLLVVSSAARVLLLALLELSLPFLEGFVVVLLRFLKLACRS